MNVVLRGVKPFHYVNNSNDVPLFRVATNAFV